MRIKIQYTFTLLILAGLQTAFAQKKDENIGTEVVNVVKPYTPTISDAFKVKETPTIEDDETTKKEPIKYSIFSFPVASTFTPSKGRAAGVDKAKQEQLYKNYFTGGIGNFVTLLGELYVTENIGDNDYVAGNIKHLSSAGGIKDVLPKDAYMTSSIDLTYGSKTNELGWNIDAGYQLQKYRWYGTPELFDLEYTPEQRELIYNDIDDGFTYNDLYVGGKIKFNESIFNDLTLKYERFSSNYDQSENRFIAKPSFQVDISNKTVKINVMADYVGGELDPTYTLFTPLKYGYANFGVQPSFGMTKDDWSFTIGGTVAYSLDTESNSKNEFHIYPKFNASLKIVGDLMVFYAGAEGGLDQNSYRDFTNRNPFVSPNIFVIPTDRQFDLFGGLRGKLSNYISYNIKGSLVSERNKPLFLKNSFSAGLADLRAYSYGNSFGVVYDDVKTVSFFGEVKADLSKNVSFGINGTFSSYDTKFEAEPWNLPAIQVGANLDVKITEKWYAGTNLFFVGERKDRFTRTDLLVPVEEVRKADSYFDANLHIGYHFSERLSFFLRGNNLASQNYEKWLDYPVQSIQVMVGGNYKFDF
jgi:hypothetical protein